MLKSIIPNFDSEISSLRFLGESGFIMAFNMTFRGPEYLHSEYPTTGRQYMKNGTTFSWIPF